MAGLSAQDRTDTFMLMAKKAGKGMGIHVDQSGGKCVITFNGEATRQQAHELRTSFIKMLIDFDEVTVDLRGADRVDLPLLQLLCSAHRSAARLSKRLVFAGARPEFLEQTASSAGYLRQTGCRFDRDKTCLWTAQYKRSAQ